MNVNTTQNGSIANYGRWLIRWRWPIIIASLALTALAASGAKNLAFVSGYRIWFSPDNPHLQAFENIENTYTKNDNILIGLTPQDGDVFSVKSIEALRELVERAWQIPYSIRVEAISNFQHSTADEDDLWVRDLISDEVAIDLAQIRIARNVALGEPFLKDRLITEQSDITGINVTLQLPENDQEAVVESMNYARSLRDELQEKYPGTGFYMTGIVALNVAFAEAGMKDMMSLTPLMYLVMIIILFISLRSISGTLTTLLVITFSMMVAMGIGGWAGVGLTPMSIVAPTIIMTLAIADCVHILITVLMERGRGRSKSEAIIESLRLNLLPVTLTSLTTAIGFLSLNWIKVPPINHLGNLTAVGVMAALFFAVVTFPAILSLLPLRSERKSAPHTGTCNRLAQWVIKSRRGALWGSLAVVAGISALIPLNDLNDRFTEYFGKSIRFRTDNDFIAEHLTSAYQVEFSLPAGGSGAISEPDYLNTTEQFVNWLRERPIVTHVTSITDVMKRLNMNMHGDDSAYYRIPDNRELAAQYLLLYEMSLPYGLDLNNQINVDKSSTRVSVVLGGETSAREMREFSSEGENWLKENAPTHMRSVGSSPAIMFANISEIALVNALSGTTIALILVSGMIMIALRSLKIGFFSLVPNLAPIAIGFGVWALLSGQINMGMAPVIGMTMGIVVDDTIHFLSKYLHARRKEKLRPEDAVCYAFKTVGPAMVTTTLTLIAGFSILAFSAFRINSDMSLLTAVTIAVALIADFILLPALLLTIDKRQLVGSTASRVVFDDKSSSRGAPAHE